MGNSFSALDVVQYLASSTLEQIEDQCLELVRNQIFREVMRQAARSHDASSQKIEKRFHSEPDIGVRTFRFASLLLQHVASNLVLEVQRQQILRKMKTQAHRRTSYNIHLENLNTQYVEPARCATSPV